MGEQIETVLRDSNWKHASDEALKIKGFWPNHLAWTEEVAVGISFRGSGDEYAVNELLFSYLAKVLREERRKSCCIAFFNRGTPIDSSVYAGHIDVDKLAECLKTLPLQSGIFGDYWWVSLLDLRASDEIPF